LSAAATAAAAFDEVVIRGDDFEALMLEKKVREESLRCLGEVGESGGLNGAIGVA
jgi:hypothetical protein